MNVECDSDALDELESAFRFNDAVLRNLIVRRKDAVIEASPLAKSAEEREQSESASGDEPRERRART